MPVRTVDVENISTNAVDLGGLGLAPGERVEVEVSDTNYYAIVTSRDLEVHSISDETDTSQVDGPEDPETVLANAEAQWEAQQAVAAGNSVLVREGRAYNSAARKATQLGIDLNDVPIHDSLDGRHTLQDLIRHVAVDVNGPTEGVVEGGARTQQREGQVLVEGQVANYRPPSSFPPPVQDGEGKPAQEGHTTQGILVNTQGQPARTKEGIQKAVGTQDENKPPSPEEDRHTESEAHQGIDPVLPEGDQATTFSALGLPGERGATVMDQHEGHEGDTVVTREPGQVEREDDQGAMGRVRSPHAPAPLPADTGEETGESTAGSEPESGATEPGTTASQTTEDAQPTGTAGGESAEVTDEGDPSTTGEPDQGDSGAGTQDEEEPQGAEQEAPQPVADPEVEVKATPSARAAADELGVDLSTVSGTGQGGAILKGDVERAAEDQTS